MADFDGQKKTDDVYVDTEARSDEQAHNGVEATGLKRALKSRHLQMIAIGGEHSLHPILLRSTQTTNALPQASSVPVFSLVLEMLFVSPVQPVFSSASRWSELSSFSLCKRIFFPTGNDSLSRLTSPQAISWRIGHSDSCFRLLHRLCWPLHRSCAFLCLGLGLLVLVGYRKWSGLLVFFFSTSVLTGAG